VRRSGPAPEVPEGEMVDGEMVDVELNDEAIAAATETVPVVA
jgi:hypothetical protein